MNNVSLARDIFTHNQAKFVRLYAWNKEFHAGIVAVGKTTLGHGRDHDLAVAQVGAIIAEDLRVGEMAWCAALAHSIDRHVESDPGERLVEVCLSLVSDQFSGEEINQMRMAIKLHSKKNDPSDSPVTITLKDADRVANVGALNLVRGGQHFHAIPAVIVEMLDTLHPDSTFRKPMCHRDALRFTIEWEDMLRLPRAKEIGRRRFAYLKHFLNQVVEDFEEVGLYPWPN